MSLVSYLKTDQCNDYLAYDIYCIRNKIACELFPSINLRFILQLVDLTLCLLGNISCFLSSAE